MAVRARGAGDAAKDRSTQRVECFEPRSCVVRDACCRPRAASPASRVLAWWWRGVFWRRLRRHRRHCVPPPLRGRCRSLAICFRGVCWRRFASPSSLRFLPGRFAPSRTLRVLTTRRGFCPQIPGHLVARDGVVTFAVRCRSDSLLRCAQPDLRSAVAGRARRVPLSGGTGSAASRVRLDSGAASLRITWVLRDLDHLGNRGPRRDDIKRASEQRRSL